MAKRERIFLSDAHKDLYPVVLRAIPTRRDVPRIKPEVPAEAFFPENFDQLYEERHDYQANRKVLIRNPFLQALYRGDLGRETVNFRTYVHGYILQVLRGKLDETGMVFKSNDYPYDLPPDTAHNLLWYKKGVSRYDRAMYLSSLFAMDNLTEGDFIIYRNPVWEKSVLDMEHDHIYTRIRDAGILNPFPSVAQIHLAMIGAPGYTIDGLFRHFAQKSPSSVEN